MLGSAVVLTLSEISQLVRFPLLFEDTFQNRNGFCLPKQLGPGAEGSINSTFMMFDLLRGGDKNNVPNACISSIFDMVLCFGDERGDSFAFRGIIQRPQSSSVAGLSSSAEVSTPDPAQLPYALPVQSKQLLPLHQLLRLVDS